MSLSFSPRHLKRYKDVAALLFKYGRGDLLKDAPIVDDALDYGAPTPVPAEARELASDLERVEISWPSLMKVGPSRRSRPRWGG